MNIKNTPLIGGIVLLIIVAGLVYFLLQRPVSPEGILDRNGNALFGNGSGNSGARDTGGTNSSGLIAGARPVVETTGFASVSSTTAVVVGTVNPRGAATTYWFEYGPTTNFGQVAETTAVGAGSRVAGAAAYITGLKPNTQYYFRVGAQNAHGRVYGAVYSFITAAK